MAARRAFAENVAFSLDVHRRAAERAEASGMRGNAGMTRSQAEGTGLRARVDKSNGLGQSSKGLASFCIANLCCSKAYRRNCGLPHSACVHVVGWIRGGTVAQGRFHAADSNRDETRRAEAAAQRGRERERGVGQLEVAVISPSQGFRHARGRASLSSGRQRTEFAKWLPCPLSCPVATDSNFIIFKLHHPKSLGTAS